MYPKLEKKLSKALKSMKNRHHAIHSYTFSVSAKGGKATVVLKDGEVRDYECDESAYYFNSMINKIKRDLGYHELCKEHKRLKKLAKLEKKAA